MSSRFFAPALAQENSNIFLIEVPESQVSPTSDPVLYLPSHEVSQILLHVLRPDADRIEYSQIFPRINGAAAARVSEFRASERGKLVRLSLRERPGFELLPGSNTIEVVASDRGGRQFEAKFVLHCPKGLCAGGGQAKLLSLQKLTDALRTGVRSERLVQYILDCGVDFALTPETEQKLRGAGAEEKVILAVRNPAAPEFAEYEQKGLRSREILEMLKAGLPQDRITEEVENRGVSFRLTSDLDAELREAGAGGKLMEAIRYMAGDTSAGQPSPGLRLEEILDLLKAGVENNRIFDLVRQRGVSFRLEGKSETALRAAGANEKLVKAIRIAAATYERSR